MKRRRFFQTAAMALPAGSALLAQQPVAPATPSSPAPVPAEPPPRSSGMEYPKIETSTGDQVASPELHFFSAVQFAALKRLSDLLMPGSALDAQAPEFLDFLIGKSPAERQRIYTAGLESLNKTSMLKHKKSFAELDDSAAAGVIAPFIKPWNSVPPADPLGHFIEVARHDVRTATLNSREYAAAAAASASGGASGGRRQGGMGMYWYPLD